MLFARVVLVIGLLIGSLAGAAVGGLFVLGGCMEVGLEDDDSAERECDILTVVFLGSGSLIGGAIGAMPGFTAVRRRQEDRRRRLLAPGASPWLTVGIAAALIAVVVVSPINGIRLSVLAALLGLGHAFLERDPTSVAPPPPAPDARPVEADASDG